jgi:two-component system OmpR family sensor kinase
LLVALLVAGWWVVRLGIRPIKHVTDAAVAITDGDMERRVEPQPHGTEAGRLADAFNIMAERRAISEQQLRQFVADASHELRTPLTTITGVLTLYRSGVLESGPVLDEALRRALQESERMTALVTDLLLLASLDQGAPLARDTVDLGEIVTDAAFDAAILDADRTIVTEIGADARVTGDEPRLRQVVANLVANAVAYTPAETSISLDVKADGEECVLLVRDDGPGMTAEQANRVFDRFYRTDTGRSRVRGGAGLGLSIVASIVNAHRGTVSVSTAPGRGTTFRVVLPRRR